MRKPLTRALCLLLALLFAASAASALYTDQDEIKNANCVNLMSTIGLLKGYEDNSFRPKNNVRRREAAKLMALVCEEDPKPSAPCSFSDVAPDDWAKDYIAYCHEKKIVSGSGGAFRPGGYVTGRELAKMLLGCLGYDTKSYQGSAWASAVDGDAKRLGIYNDFTADPGAYISRDDTCLLIYNALQCDAVASVDANGKATYVLDDLMNPKTYMEHRFGMVRYVGVLVGNEFADLDAKDNALPQGQTKLAGHATFAVSTPMEYLGRMVEIYTVNTNLSGKTYHATVGDPAPLPDVAFSTDDISIYNIMFDQNAYRTSTSTKYYVNGTNTSADFSRLLGEDYTITALDYDGDKTIDTVMVYSYSQATVTSVSPLRISIDGQPVSAVSRSGKKYEEGDVCRYLFIGGKYRAD